MNAYKTIFTSILALAFAVFAPVATNAQTPDDVELITNGDFETGDLTGWTVDAGNPLVWPYGIFGIECFGEHFYASGNQSYAAVYQNIDVSQYMAAIDNGDVQIRLLASMGSWVNSDIATVTVSYLDDNDQSIGTPLFISAIDNPGLSSGSAGLTDPDCLESDSGNVPIGTRNILVEIESTRGSGSDNDGYVDNLSLKLNPDDEGDIVDPLLGVEIIAHRGNSSVTPENTIVAIDSAFVAGADHVEIDIRLTSDGVAVLMHDSTVDRTTNGSGAIASMTLAQVKQLDAGSWKGAQFAGEKVPTLAEALVAVEQRGRLLLDIKVSGMGQAIQAAINEASSIDGTRTYSAADVWIWPGPNSDYQSNIANPEYLLGTIPSVSTWQTPGYFAIQRALGVKGWDVSSGQMTAAFAEAARNEGMVASVYTINNVNTMQAFIDLGVTAMETDYPATLANLVLLRGDVNLDGVVDFGDIEPFVDVLLSSGYQNEADITGDGYVDFDDIEPLVDLLFN